MNYNPNFSSSVNMQTGAKKKSAKGCGTIVLFIILFVIGFLVAYNFILPALFPNSIRGNLQNLIVFPTGEGKYKLWVQTDGSFHYTSKKTSGGSYSVSSEGLFCKTYSYVYDPLSKDVLNAFKTSYDDLPPMPEMLYVKGKIWVVISNSKNPTELNVYNADDYKEVLNIKSFCQKTSELSTGIEKIYMEHDRPVRLRITTKDGKELLYAMEEDKFFNTTQDYEKYYKANDTSYSGMFLMDREKNSDKRKKIYYVTGPKYQLYFSHPQVSFLLESKSSFYDKMDAFDILPNKAYLEGELLFSDDEVAIILHQDNIGKNANRMLSCVDKSGKEMWTVQQKDLYDEMKGSESDSFSEMFFLKSYMSAQRMGNVVVMIYKPEGAMGFDLASGKKVWEFDN